MALEDTQNFGMGEKKLSTDLKYITLVKYTQCHFGSKIKIARKSHVKKMIYWWTLLKKFQLKVQGVIVHYDNAIHSKSLKNYRYTQSLLQRYTFPTFIKDQNTHSLLAFFLLRINCNKLNKCGDTETPIFVSINFPINFIH